MPNCTNSRARWQRLCKRCFARLPDRIKVPLAAAKRERRETDWRKLRRETGDFMALPDPNLILITAAAIERVTPQRAYQMQQQLLGERD